jgi:hypothetical protein
MYVSKAVPNLLGAYRTFLEAMELDLSLQRGLQSSPTRRAAALSPATSPRIGPPQNAAGIKPIEQQAEQQRLINVDDDESD